MLVVKACPPQPLGVFLADPIAVIVQVTLAALGRKECRARVTM